MLLELAVLLFIFPGMDGVICPPNEMSVECPGCQRTCANRGKHQFCPMFCVEEGVCKCIPRYYRNSKGECVPASECTPT